ncbi:MAG TPA: hypothetical protein VNI57_03560, partial [Candidatus Saccharimonadales bacterium]|nr:hypothetical protein [Candidatus Saccharimonadales bacterium]
DQFPVIRNRPVIPVFGTEPIPVDRGRGRFLQFSMQAWRMGPPRDTPDNGSVRIEFYDGEGRRLSWLDNPRYFLEALPAGRWVPVTFRTHIPPAARTLEVSLIPDPGSPDTLIVDQPVLRYSPGNDPALESLFPYQRYRE